jgi:FG-GAP-like repeat
VTRRGPVLALLALLALPGAAHAGVSFTSTPYPLPAADTMYHSQLGAVGVVDLNNDSRPDIVAYRGGGNLGKVFVLLNHGDGSFAAAQPHVGCGSANAGGTMVTGQFDAGPTTDVILGCDSATGLDELLGNGDGTLGTATHFPSIGFNTPLGLWPGDSGAAPAVLYTQSAGEFYLCYRATNDLGTAVCPPDTSATDADGPSGHASVGPTLATGHFYDNAACSRDDVIVSPYQRNIRAWGLNPFGGPNVAACATFAYTERAVQGLPTGVNLTTASPADLNGDGTPDLLMRTDGGHLASLIWQTGGADLAGGFPPGQQAVVTPTIPFVDLGWGPLQQTIQVADFDRDGHLDAALVGESTGVTTATLAVHRGRGDGSFDSPVTFSIPGGSPDTYNSIGPEHLAVGDLNGDGAPDVVTIAQYDNAVTVLLNGTPAVPGGPAPGDKKDTIAPALSALRLTRTTFAVGSALTPVTAARAKRGTTLRYRLSEAARVTIKISRLGKGRRKGRSCVKPTPKLRRAKSCTRATLVGTLSRAGSAGPNTLVFTGRTKKWRLRPGRHRMSLVGTDAAKNRSKPKQLPCKVRSSSAIRAGTSRSPSRRRRRSLSPPPPPGRNTHRASDPRRGCPGRAVPLTERAEGRASSTSP